MIWCPLPLVTCIVASAVVGSFASGCAQDVRPDGSAVAQPETGYIGFPLGGPPPNGYYLVRPVGATFTDGQLIVFNLGEKDLEIVDVEPELAGDGLRYLGAKITGLDRELGSVQVEDRYPPTNPELGPTQPATGVVLPAADSEADRKRGYELLMGYKVVGLGRSTVRAVEVTYEVAGQERTQSWTSTIAVCTPDVAPDGECAFEYGDYESGD